MVTLYEQALAKAPQRLLRVLRDGIYTNKVLLLETVDWLDQNGFSTLADDLTEEATQ